MLRRALFSRRTLAFLSGSTLVAAGGGYYYLNSGPSYPPSTKETRRPPPPWTPPSRMQMLESLKASSRQAADGSHPDEFDLLVVGGGATGAGVAVDAASRGLKVALVERDDFSSGMRTLSRFSPCLSLRLYFRWKSLGRCGLRHIGAHPCSRTLVSLAPHRVRTRQ